jgi:predicted RNA-binding Zn-ribbon protein involved in translation (DUF1610 family)
MYRPMATREQVQCLACDWAGEVTELDDTYGEPDCPTCGAAVKLQ